MHSLHIVRLHADIGSITDANAERVAHADYQNALGFLGSRGEKLGDAPLGGGVYLVSHEVLLQFFLGCRTNHPTFQLEVFSLQESEKQLVPPTSGEPELRGVARFRVPRAS